MMRSRVLVAVLLSALAACGDDNDNGDGNPNNDQDPPADRRQNVTGTYAATGSVEIVVLGNTQTQPLDDTLRITQGTESDQALLLNHPLLGCDLRATMTGERTFTLEQTTCTVPPQNGCTITANVTSGQGGRDATSGTLTMQAQGTATADCGGGLTFAGTFSMDLTGTRTGD